MSTSQVLKAINQYCKGATMIRKDVVTEADGTRTKVTWRFGEQEYSCFDDEPTGAGTRSEGSRSSSTA